MLLLPRATDGKEEVAVARRRGRSADRQATMEMKKGGISTSGTVGICNITLTLWLLFLVRKVVIVHIVGFII